MPSPNELVTEAWGLSKNYAAEAQAGLTSFLDSLNKINYSVPAVSVTWSSVLPPTLPTVPDLPTLPTIEFNAPSDKPSTFTETPPTFVIDSTFEAAPTLDLPAPPTLAFSTEPTVPSPSFVDVPTAPTYTMPTTPTLLSLGSVTFSGVDLRDDMAAQLDDTPVLTLVAPTPYTYTQSAAYTSTLLGALKDKLLARIQGGSGLAPAVEQAIWDRARSREAANSAANEAEVMRTSEALGFKLPAGVTAMQLRAAQQDTVDKSSSLSRDIAVKQAELEQANLKEAINEGQQLEGKLVDYSYQLERLTFENAQAAAANAIAVHAAAVQQYQALLAGYEAFQRAYKTLIDGQMTKVEVYKAELQAEATKAQVNSTLVEQYRVSMEAVRIQASIFQLQLDGAKTLADIERLKIEAAGEQVRAYVAGINAQTARVEAYKAEVAAQGTVVEVYRTKAQAFATVVGAQSAKAQADLDRFKTSLAAKSLEWDGYKANIEAERTRLSSLTSQSSMMVDGFKAAANAIEATANSQARLWETKIKDYEAGQNITLSAAKMNSEAFMSTRQAQIDTAKVGAQVFAQLSSSAYSILHASAGVSGSGSTSVSYGYSGDVSSAVAPVTSI